MAGLVLLRVAPLLSTTSSLTFTLSEDIFIRPLTLTSLKSGDNLRRHANRILPTHGRWLWPGMGILCTTYPMSVATAIANLAHPWRDGRLDLDFHGTSLKQRAAAGFYLAGIAFSILHLAWGYRALYLLYTIRQDVNVDGDETKDNTAAMASWLRVNAIRGALADFPSWVCYFSAFIISLS